MFKVNSGGGTIPEIRGNSVMGYLAFVPKDPNNIWRNFDFDKYPAAITSIRNRLDTTTSDLSRFARTGGRMITWHGWADPSVTPYLTIGSYEDIIAAINGSAQGSYRLFMVLGMAHCGGGASKIRCTR